MTFLLPDWFLTPLGQSLLEVESRRLRGLLPPAYYGRGLQLGAPTIDFLSQAEVHYRFTADLCPAENGYPLLAEPDALPFGEKSLDLIVLPHILDFWADPHAVLREASQILVPEGCLAISGFNPWSLWGGVRRIRKRGRNSELWKAHFYPMRRIQDWLTLLGFEPVGGAMLIYQPPLQSKKWRCRLGFMDRAGDRWWPALAAVYILVARRREPALRTNALRAANWRRLLAGVAQPAARWPAESTATKKHEQRLE